MSTALPTTYRPHTNYVTDHVTDRETDHVPITYRPRKVSEWSVSSTAPKPTPTHLCLLVTALLFHSVVQGFPVARLRGALPLLVDGGQGLPGLPGLLDPLLLPRHTCYFSRRYSSFLSSVMWSMASGILGGGGIFASPLSRFFAYLSFFTII